MLGSSSIPQRAPALARVDDMARAAQPQVLPGAAQAAPDDRVSAVQNAAGAAESRQANHEAGSQGNAAEAATPREGELSVDEEKTVQRLKQRDAEVRAHEQAHAAAGGSHAGSPSYDFETGPDGKRYAVGGEVSIDTSEIPGDAEASIRKLEQVARAANAPAEPSGQDRKVAANARAKIARLQSERAASDDEARVRGGESGDVSASGQGAPLDEQTEEGLRAVSGARAQKAYASVAATPEPRSGLDITACAKCGGAH